MLEKTENPTTNCGKTHSLMILVFDHKTQVIISFILPTLKGICDYTYGIIRLFWTRVLYKH